MFLLQKDGTIDYSLIKNLASTTAKRDIFLLYSAIYTLVVMKIVSQKGTKSDTYVTLETFPLLIYSHLPGRGCCPLPEKSLLNFSLS